MIYDSLTFVMVKPDATERNITGSIIDIFVQNGLVPVGMKYMTLTDKQARMFYKEHESRPFFDDLCSYIVSGVVLPMVLKGDGSEDVVLRARRAIGATDPSEADSGTIRKVFGLSKEKNSVHGSDSRTSADREIPFFFSTVELRL